MGFQARHLRACSQNPYSRSTSQPLFDQIIPPLSAELKKKLAIHGGLKIWLSIYVNYQWITVPKGIVYKVLLSQAWAATSDNDIDQTLCSFKKEIIARNDLYFQKSSDMWLCSIEKATFYGARFISPIGPTEHSSGI